MKVSKLSTPQKGTLLLIGVALVRVAALVSRLVGGGALLRTMVVHTPYLLLLFLVYRGVRWARWAITLIFLVGFVGLVAYPDEFSIRLGLPDLILSVACVAALWTPWVTSRMEEARSQRRPDGL